MSTEYTTQPLIPYGKIFDIKDVEIQDAPGKYFIMEHKVLFKNGSYIYVLNDGGFCRFIRFGINRVEKSVSIYNRTIRC